MLHLLRNNFNWLPQRKWIRRSVMFLLLVVTVSAVACLSLLFIDHWLVYESPLQKADLVMVDHLGKQLEAAVSLYREGYVSSILVQTEVPSQYMTLSDFDPIGELLHQDLVNRGIAETKILHLRLPKGDFYTNRVALYRHSRENHWDSIILLPTAYNSQKEKMIVDKLRPNFDIQVVIRPIFNDHPSRIQLVALENAFVSYWYIRLFRGGEPSTPVVPNAGNLSFNY